MIAPYTAKQLESQLKGFSVRSVERRGKQIIFTLLKGKKSQYVILHLRMSGRLRVVSKEEPRGAHDRISVAFHGGDELRFVDPRKFGRFLLVDSLQLEKHIERLGPEPLDAKFSAQDLFKILSRRKRALKPLLLDQEVIVGLGNIYVDESLWAAKLHPLRKASSLSEQEVSNLHREIRRILNEAIKMNGTDFGDGVVHNGKFVPKVYGRAGKPCKRCKNLLDRLVVAQRGTVVCNHCQRDNPGKRR